MTRRTKVNHLVVRNDELRAKIAAVRAENERLKAGIHEYACTGTDHPCGCYDQFLSERAEIERLRAALTEIDWKSKCDIAAEIAQRALEPKPASTCSEMENACEQDEGA